MMFFGGEHSEKKGVGDQDPSKSYTPVDPHHEHEDNLADPSSLVQRGNLSHGIAETRSDASTYNSLSASIIEKIVKKMSRPIGCFSKLPLGKIAAIFTGIAGEKDFFIIHQLEDQPHRVRYQCFSLKS